MAAGQSRREKSSYSLQISTRSLGWREEGGRGGGVKNAYVVGEEVSKPLV